MAYKVISISLKNQLIIHHLEEFKRNGGNVSGLIESLLEQYFLNNNSKELLTKEMMTLLEIKGKLEEFLRWKEEIEPKLFEIEEKLKEKQEKELLEEQLPLLRKLREIVFHDIEDLLEYDYYKQRQGLPPPENAIKIRLTTFATEHNLSYPEARDLFFKAFPELDGRLEGVL